MAADLIQFEPAKVALIKRMVAKDATDDELELFLHQCRRTGLDPLARQIYFQKRRTKNGDQMTILTAIDGYRLIADRTGLYAGNDDPVYDDEDNVGKATVTVYKMIANQRCPFTATARWSQYYPGDAQGFMWKKMPHLMLGKCAEALALRKAFPAELSGVYTEDEMAQAGPADSAPTEPKDVTPQPKQIPTPAPRAASIYDRENPALRGPLEDQLKKAGVPQEFWTEISERLHGRISTDLRKVIEQVKQASVDDSGIPF